MARNEQNKRKEERPRPVEDDPTVLYDDEVVDRIIAGLGFVRPSLGPMFYYPISDMAVSAVRSLMGLRDDREFALYEKRVRREFSMFWRVVCRKATELQRQISEREAVEIFCGFYPAHVSFLQESAEEVRRAA